MSHLILPWYSHHGDSSVDLIDLTLALHNCVGVVVVVCVVLEPSPRPDEFSHYASNAPYVDPESIFRFAKV